MITTEIIAKKSEGRALTKEEINFMIRGYTDGVIPDYQMAAFLMAIKLKDMDVDETALLTQSMLESGGIIDLTGLAGVKVDKHSTGGVGDTTTLVIVPIVAACGGTVVKMSGRGLGHTGGTIDKLETIPGYHAEQSEMQMKAIATSTGAVIVSQSDSLAPADKKIYALRDVTATVDSIPLIASSIMSKKIASGTDAIVLDVKVGSGALLADIRSAKRLASLMVEIGKKLGKRIVAVLTDMDQPLGMAIGNALEVREAIQLLSGNVSAQDPLYKICITLASEMLLLSEVVGSKIEAERKAEQVIQSGEALRKLNEILEAEGANPVYLSVNGIEQLCTVRRHIPVCAKSSGHIVKIKTEQLGRAAQLLGAGRAVKEDKIDPAVGIVMEKRLGEYIQNGEKICTLYVNQDKNLQSAIEMILDSIKIGQNIQKAEPLVLEIIT